MGCYLQTARYKTFNSDKLPFSKNSMDGPIGSFLRKEQIVTAVNYPKSSLPGFLQNLIEEDLFGTGINLYSWHKSSSPQSHA